MPNAKREASIQAIDQYREAVILYLRKRVPSHHVEDFAQETLLNVHAYVSNGNTLDKPLAFLYETARNVVRKNYRDQKMAAVTDAVADVDALGFASQAPSVERNVISELDFEAFCVAVGSLPEKCRKAFVLRKVYQYSYREIAEYCGISVNTVKTYIKRGFKLVESHYEEERGRSCSGSRDE